MKTAEHAAQLAEALRVLCNISDDIQSKDEDDGIILLSRTTEARAALAAWDKHNAPTPKQEALL